MLKETKETQLPCVMLDYMLGSKKKVINNIGTGKI